MIASCHGMSGRTCTLAVTASVMTRAPLRQRTPTPVKTTTAQPTPTMRDPRSEAVRQVSATRQLSAQSHLEIVTARRRLAEVVHESAAAGEVASTNTAAGELEAAPKGSTEHADLVDCGLRDEQRTVDGRSLVTRRDVVLRAELPGHASAARDICTGQQTARQSP
jgi:hypothetical protein